MIAFIAFPAFASLPMIAGLLGLTMFGAAAVAGVTMLELGNTRGAARIADGALWLMPGNRRVALDDLEMGYVVPAKKPRLELVRKNGTAIVIEADDVAAADAFLAATGLDVAKRRCRVTFTDPIARIVAALVLLGALGYAAMFGLAFFMAVLPKQIALISWITALLLSVVGVVQITAPPELTIGVDGISIRRTFGTIFVPLDEVQEVRPAGLAVEIVRRGKPTIRLNAISGVQVARLEALQVRVLQAQAARNASGAPVWLLDRGERSFTAWRDALGSVTQTAGSYRAQGLSPDDLAAILEGAKESVERRLGAAIALASIDANRVRIAAAASANEHVRIALESVANGSIDEAEIESAIADSAAPSHPRARRA